MDPKKFENPEEQKFKGDQKGKQGKKTPQTSGKPNSWYTNYSESALVGLNLSKVRGTADMKYPTGTNAGGISIPSVASLVMQLAVPVKDDGGWKDGIRRIFTSLRQANRTNVNYTVYDVEKYVLAVRSLHAAYCYAKRAYEATNTYKTMDRAIPTQLLIAMGLDPDDFAENAANLRMLGTRLGTMIAANAPLKLPLFDRTRWMFSNVFADSNDAKPNYYLFSLSGQIKNGDGGDYVNHGLDTFAYDGNNVTWLRITINDPIGTPSETGYGMNYATFADRVNLIFNRFRQNSVFADISGDVLNAFGQGAVYQAEKWESTAYITPKYDEAALSQIQNAKTVGVKCSADDTTIMDVYCQAATSQDNPAQYAITRGKFLEDYGYPSPLAMKVRTAFTWPSATVPNGMIGQFEDVYNKYVDINWYKDKIDANGVLSTTRLMPGACALPQAVNKNVATATFDIIGTEIPIVAFTFNTVEVYPVVTNKYGVAKQSATTIMVSFVGAGATDSMVADIVSAYAERVANLSSFDYHMRLYYVHYIADGAGLKYNAIPFWDYNVYARITGDQLTSYNALADMSLLYVDFLRKSSKTETVSLNK